jgi:hypothetical protein
MALLPLHSLIFNKSNPAHNQIITTSRLQQPNSTSTPSHHQVIHHHKLPCSNHPFIQATRASPLLPSIILQSQIHTNIHHQFHLFPAIPITKLTSPWPHSP